MHIPGSKKIPIIQDTVNIGTLYKFGRVYDMLEGYLQIDVDVFTVSIL